MSRPSVPYRAILLVVVVVPFLATLFAIRLLWERAVQPVDLELLAVMYALSALGVTVGLHRMLTHRSFTAPVVVRAILLILGCLSLEGSPLEWATTHTKHHANSDREGDPHSPMEGFWHAHIGWLFSSPRGEIEIYGKAFTKDPLVMGISRTWLLWAALGLLVPLAIGGWQGLLWGGLVRIFLTHHVTWSVNSVCHTFGKRPYETRDASRNEWIVGLLAFGEGWHNNHHAFPRSAFHGLHWWQFDLSGYLIWTLEKLHLATNVYRVSPEMRARRQQHPTPLPMTPQPTAVG